MSCLWCRSYRASDDSEVHALLLIDGDNDDDSEYDNGFCFAYDKNVHQNYGGRTRLKRSDATKEGGHHEMVNERHFLILRMRV